MNQCEQILAYIQEHGSITPMEALNYCGCMRLSARIHDLRNMGHDIVMDLVAVKSRSGVKTKVSRYRLNEQ